MSFRLRAFNIVLSVILSVMLFAGCSQNGNRNAAESITPSLPSDAVSITDIAVETQSATATIPASTQGATQDLTQTATTSKSNLPPNALIIWWPVSLAPDDASRQITLQQLTNYEKSSGITLVTRFKRASGSGSIYETLKAGIVAAPSVMPDLTLMQRSELVQAAAGKIIEPVDTASLNIDDFFSSGLTLGKVNGIQFGIPYTLQIAHTIYRVSVVPTAPHTFDIMLKVGEPYLFPAGTTKGVNPTLLAQYIAEGGRFVDERGTPVLDIEPLREVLHYYEQSVAAKVSGSQLLDYTTIAQYWPLFTGGKANFMQVDSTTYLAQRQALTGIGVTTVPMPGNDTVIITDGWYWVITTANPERQTMALEAIEWFLQVQQQSKFTQSMNILPSRKGSLVAWGKDDYADFVTPLLDLPAIPPADAIDATVAGVMQKAFEDVLSARKSADTAAADAVGQLSK